MYKFIIVSLGWIACDHIVDDQPEIYAKKQVRWSTVFYCASVHVCVCVFTNPGSLACILSSNNALNYIQVFI